MKKICLITILTMALACTACSSSKKPLNNTPATAEPENTDSSVAETPKGEDIEGKEELPENDSDNKEEGDLIDEDSKKQEQEEPSNDNSDSDFQVLDDLSDDLSSFQLQIDDEIYSFPMKYSDFIAHGFELEDDDESKKVEATHYIFSDFNRGDLQISTSIVNLDDKEQPISECYIGSIEIDKGYRENGKGAFIALPKGIIFNKSTLNDIKAAYGEPKMLLEYSSYTTYQYEFKVYQRIEIEIGTESGVVQRINVMNLTGK